MRVLCEVAGRSCTQVTPRRENVNVILLFRIDTCLWSIERRGHLIGDAPRSRPQPILLPEPACRNLEIQAGQDPERGQLRRRHAAMRAYGAPTLPRAVGCCSSNFQNESRLGVGVVHGRPPLFTPCSRVAAVESCLSQSPFEIPPQTRVHAESRRLRARAGHWSWTVTVKEVMPIAFFPPPSASSLHSWCDLAMDETGIHHIRCSLGQIDFDVIETDYRLDTRSVLVQVVL